MLLNTPYTNPNNTSASYQTMLETIRQGRAAQQTAFGAYAAILDQLDFVLIVLSAKNEVVFANQSAREMLEHHPIFTILNEIFTVIGPQKPVFENAFCAALMGEKTMIQLRTDVGAELVSMTQMPSQNPGDRALNVLLTLGRRPSGGLAALGLFSQALALTRNEEAILLKLYAGDSPAEIAKHRNVAITTVRSHIRGILQKSECDSIRDLLAMLAKLPPAPRAELL